MFQRTVKREPINYINFMFQASNIDDVLNYHNDFLNNCLKDCMLTTPDLVRIVNKLMVVCVTFSNFIQVSCLLIKNMVCKV